MALIPKYRQFVLIFYFQVLLVTTFFILCRNFFSIIWVFVFLSHNPYFLVVLSFNSLSLALSIANITSNTDFANKQAKEKNKQKYTLIAIESTG